MVVGVVIAAAVLIPLTDPLTQCLLAGPLIFLYMGDVFLVKFLTNNTDSEALHYKKTRSESRENQQFCVGFYRFEKIMLKCINFVSLSNRVNSFMLISADSINV